MVKILLLFFYCCLFATNLEASQISLPPLTVSISLNNITCYGGSDGYITAAADGGFSPYSYSWSGGQSGSNLIGLSAGTYYLTVTDSANNTLTETITLSQPAQILHNVNAEICSGDSIYLQSSYQDASGNYYDTLTSVNGCDSVIITNLLVNPVPLVSIATADISCNGGNDGAATAVVSDSVSQYFFMWSNGLTTQSVSGLNPGIYSVTVTDSKGCYTVKSSSVDQPELIGNYSGLLNPSFEQMDCCPSGYSQLDCATGWYQPTKATSDYFNTCNFLFSSATNAGLVPFPHGNGAAGCIFSVGWQEYLGTCLTQPLIAGSEYSLQFKIASLPIDGSGNSCNGGNIGYGPIDITLFGNTNCITYQLNTQDCPGVTSGNDPDFVVVGSQQYTPASVWQDFSLTFTPSQNVQTILIGSPCTLPQSYSSLSGGCYPYFFFDNMILTFPQNADTICQGDSIFLQGAYQKTSGTYYDTLVASNGCDSIVTTQLQVLGSVSNFQQNICNGDSAFLQNNYQVEAGIYYDTIFDAYGCYHISKTTLTVSEAVTVNQQLAICDGDSVFLEGAFQKNEGQYIDTFYTEIGCDSIVTTSLTVNTINASVSLSFDSLLANPFGEGYQWINCYDNSIIDSETSQFFIPDSSGSYAVIITENGCTNTSACVLYSVSAIRYIEGDNTLKIIPNPNNGKFIIQTSSVDLRYKVCIMNILGEKIFTRHIYSPSAEIIFNYPSGMYMLMIESEKISKLFKLIIE